MILMQSHSAKRHMDKMPPCICVNFVQYNYLYRVRFLKPSLEQFRTLYYTSDRYQFSMFSILMINLNM